MGRQVWESSVSHTFKTDFHSSGNKEPLKDFKQGTDILGCFIQKDHMGYTIGNKLQVAQEATYKLVTNDAGLITAMATARSERH